MRDEMQRTYNKEIKEGPSGNDYVNSHNEAYIGIQDKLSYPFPGLDSNIIHLSYKRRTS